MRAPGLGLGLVGGLIHRSLLRGVMAGAAGLVLGGVTGVLTARVLALVYYKNLSGDDLTYSLIVHGGVWGAVGAVGGLAFGLGLGGWDRLARATVGGAGCSARGGYLRVRGRYLGSGDDEPARIHHLADPPGGSATCHAAGRHRRGLGRGIGCRRSGLRSGDRFEGRDGALRSARRHRDRSGCRPGARLPPRFHMAAVLFSIPTDVSLLRPSHDDTSIASCTKDQG